MCFSSCCRHLDWVWDSDGLRTHHPHRPRPSPGGARDGKAARGRRARGLRLRRRTPPGGHQLALRQWSGRGGRSADGAAQLLEAGGGRLPHAVDSVTAHADTITGRQGLSLVHCRGIPSRQARMPAKPGLNSGGKCECFGSCKLSLQAKLFMTGRSTPKSVEGLLGGSDDDGGNSPEHVAQLAVTCSLRFAKASNTLSRLRPELQSRQSGP